MAKVKTKKDYLNEALFKKAIGYKTEEVAEEFSIVDNELVLQKRKLNKKVYPPDLSAIQLLLQEAEEEEKNIYSNFTLEELEKEREYLKKLLDKSEKENK